MTRRDEQREATRQRIAEVAAELLSDGQGVPPTTLAVQEAAGVTRGALLHHYPRREDLLAAAVTTLRESNAIAVQEALDRTHNDDPLERAVRALEAAVLRPQMAAELGLRAAAETDVDLRSALRRVQRDSRDSLQAVVEAAFGPDYATLAAYPTVASLTVVFFQGLAITHARPGRTTSRERLISDWIATIRLVFEASSAEVLDRPRAQRQAASEPFGRR